MSLHKTNELASRCPRIETLYLYKVTFRYRKTFIWGHITTMPAYNVRKSIDIAAPHDRVHGVLVDYQSWPDWSPWVCAERDCRLSLYGSAGEIGHGQDWDGKIIGSGQMRLTAHTSERIDMKLKFIKPFKSTADIAFKLQPLGNGDTRVEWIMDSSLPFFMFFMTANIKAMIGADYRRGLLQLKDYVETGYAGTKSDVAGIVDVEAFSYIGSEGSALIENIGDILGEKLSTLYAAHIRAHSGGSPVDSTPDASPTPLTFYNKMDIKTRQCDFTAALAINEPPAGDKLAGDAGETAVNISPGHQTACKALKVVHTGEYRHLGNAWATGMMHMRAMKKKPLKSHPPFEKYISDPQSTPGHELVTEIYLPVK